MMLSTARLITKFFNKNNLFKEFFLLYLFVRVCRTKKSPARMESYAD